MRRLHEVALILILDSRSRAHVCVGRGGCRRESRVFARQCVAPFAAACDASIAQLVRRQTSRSPSSPLASIRSIIRAASISASSPCCLMNEVGCAVDV